MDFVFNKLNDKNIAPYLSEMIAVRNSNGKVVGMIPLTNYKPEYGKRLYRFAVMSDIHFKESGEDSIDLNGFTDIDDATTDFKRALNFLSEEIKEKREIDDIEFACVCGDIMCNHGHVYNFNELAYPDGNALTDYGVIRKQFIKDSKGKNIYTCTGEHDTNYYDWTDSREESYNKRTLWADATGMGRHGYDDHFQHEYINETGKTIKDNFYFLSMTKYNMGSVSDMFHTYTYDELPENKKEYAGKDDIDILADYLEEHKNERTFIFTHYFFPMRSGAFAYSYYNGSRWLGGKWLKKLTDLSYKYKNTIWFSGHSHYEWGCQGVTKETLTANGSAKYYNWKENNLDANVWPVNIDKDHQRECGWALHLPSCSGIRPYGYALGTESSSKIYNTSEFAIVDVYENYIDFRGLSLVGQNRTEIGNLYYNPIAQYRLDTTIVPETKEHYDLVPLTVDDFNNDSWEEKEICITSAAYDNYHIGSIENEFKNAAIYKSFYTSINENDESITYDISYKGSDVNFDLNNIDETSDEYKRHYNHECQMHAEMRDLVNMRPNQFIFTIKRDSGNDFYIKNSYGKYLKLDDRHVKLDEEALKRHFQIDGNITSYTASSTLFSQINNKKLLRIKKGEEFVLKFGNDDITTLSEITLKDNGNPQSYDGWTYLYMYEVIRKPGNKL